MAERYEHLEDGQLSTPFLCYDEDMEIADASEIVSQIVKEILHPDGEST